MNLKDQVEELASACFDIEAQLPSFSMCDVLDDKQKLRRKLYKIRCDIMALKRYAEMIDEGVMTS